MFGESVEPTVRDAAEKAVRECDAVLVVGSSLATYSAWRLVKSVGEVEGKGVAVVNLGGVRGEETWFGEEGKRRGERVRVEMEVGCVLEGVCREVAGGMPEGWNGGEEIQMGSLAAGLGS